MGAETTHEQRQEPTFAELTSEVKSLREEVAELRSILTEHIEKKPIPVQDDPDEYDRYRNWRY